MKTSQEVPDFISKQVESSRLFFLEMDDSEDLSVAYGGYERCRPDYRINRRNFPWYALEFVSRGRGRLWLDEREHDLHPWSFYLYGPDIAHRIESSADNPMGKYFVGFQGSGVEAFFDRYGIVPGRVVRSTRSEPIRRSFDMMIDRGVRKSGLVRPLCSLMTRQLLLMLMENGNADVNTESSAFGAYKRARQFMEANFMKLKTQEATARACGLDAPYLCRLFARYHDESPYQYLTRLRMDHAASLLLEEGISVKAVATAMGFKDACHFSRVFKSVHDVPPSRFRHSMHPQWPG
ncbi:MAG: helix-turn-helix domain-containing protein [Verrucomicrobiales bacterium]